MKMAGLQRKSFSPLTNWAHSTDSHVTPYRSDRALGETIELSSMDITGSNRTQGKQQTKLREKRIRLVPLKTIWVLFRYELCGKRATYFLFLPEIFLPNSVLDPAPLPSDLDFPPLSMSSNAYSLEFYVSIQDFVFVNG